MWVYGSGFPKGQHQLKPAHEPMVLARKPFKGSMKANIEKYGTGGLYLDKCRVGTEKVHNDRFKPNVSTRLAGIAGDTAAQLSKDDYQERVYVEGRWPANLIHDGSQEVVDLFPHTKSGKACKEPTVWDSPAKTEDEGGVLMWARSDTKTTHHNTDGSPKLYGDEGSAARFFYVPKVSKKDRNEGIEANTHPTVKPTDLMHYLIRMVTPSGGVVLDPFMGSGSTGKAAVRHGYDFIGIEMEEQSFEVAKARIEYEDNND